MKFGNVFLAYIRRILALFPLKNVVMEKTVIWEGNDGTDPSDPLYWSLLRCELLALSLSADSERIREITSRLKSTANALQNEVVENFEEGDEHASMLTSFKRIEESCTFLIKRAEDASTK